MWQVSRQQGGEGRDSEHTHDAAIKERDGNIDEKKEKGNGATCVHNINTHFTHIKAKQQQNNKKNIKNNWHFGASSDMNTPMSTLILTHLLTPLNRIDCQEFGRITRTSTGPSESFKQKNQTKKRIFLLLSLFKLKIFYDSWINQAYLWEIWFHYGN